MDDIRIICLIVGNWKIEDLNFSFFVKLALGIGNVLQSIRRKCILSQSFILRSFGVDS